MKPNANTLINCSGQKKIKFDGETIKSSNCRNLLGAKVDKKLNFNAHVEMHLPHAFYHVSFPTQFITEQRLYLLLV